jgi:hypothetical protein
VTGARHAGRPHRHQQRQKHKDFLHNHDKPVYMLGLVAQE